MSRTFLRLSLPLLSLLCLIPLTPASAEEPPLRNPANLSLRNEVRLAIDKGLAYLKKEQNADGSWGGKDPLHAAITALPLMAFHGEPQGAYRGNDTPEFMKKGYAFLRTLAKPDGGIYNEDFECVNTAIAMMALMGPNDPQDGQLLAKANQFLIKMQNANGAIASFDGGFSYGPGMENRQWGDLHNTVCALEALRTYEALERPGSDKLNWDAAIGFINRCQNLSSHNKEAWVSDDAENKGGYVYSPMSSTAGDKEVPDRHRRVLLSYGSMTYAGVLCLVYSGVDSTDPRIAAALDWTAKNYSVEENPRLGKQGLYLYYNLMANALATANVDAFTLPDGRKVNWAKDLAVKLISLQKNDGTWVNDNSRWLENDPILVTSYALVALDMISRRL